MSATDPASRRDEPTPPPHDDDRDVLEGPVTFADELVAYARRAHAAAARSTPDERSSVVPGMGSEALMWIRASREALAAAKLTVGPLDDGERAAIAAQLAGLRGKLASREVQVRELVGFIDQLAAEFESADTATAERVAGRLRRQIAIYAADAEAERDAAEAAREAAG